jgi:hypothetical protein
MIYKAYEHTVSGSHKDWETNTILKNVKGKAGIASTGNAGISLAHYKRHESYVYVPTNTPIEKINKILSFTPNVVQIGQNYVECFKLAAQLMKENHITNVTAGIIDRSVGDQQISVQIHELYGVPDLVFVPSANLDCAVGIASWFKRNDFDTKVVACVLPDHPLSPLLDKNIIYDRKAYSSCITYDSEGNMPGLNLKYLDLDNLIIDSIIPATNLPNGAECDFVCYQALNVSKKYSNMNTTVIFTGVHR